MIELAEFPFNSKKRVKFSILTEPGHEVYVAGSFNGWNPKKHKLIYSSGSCSTSFLLPAGRYEYKFVVDGEWCVDPACPNRSPNGLGTLNSILVIS